MKRHSKLLGDMNMRKARGVSNDDICNEWLVSRVAHHRDRIGWDILVSAAIPWRGSKAIAGLDARPPATYNDLFDTFSSFSNLAALQRIKTGHQAGVLDHKGHEFSGIAPDSEEFQPIFFDELLECSMGSNSDAVAVGIFQYLPESDEGLDISPRPHDLYDDIQLGRRFLTRPAA